MTKLFYMLLYRGLLACGLVISAIIAIVLWRKVLWRKMWVAGNNFSELGSTGNGVLLMAVLVLASFVLAWRIKRASNKLDKD